MNTLHRSLLLASLTLGVGLLSWSADAQTPVADPDPIEVQARGPIHEAFAQPVVFQPDPAPLVPQAPPQPIPEEPPPQAPEGTNVQWLNGYWSWDAERNEFIWISGLYRDAPPGQRYVEGYWEQTPDGWRWVAGFWTPQDQPEIPYLPQPPASVDNGPSVPPPDDNSFYTPGVWVYRETRYVWQPGFWQPIRPGFLWSPACYHWTPRGYLFVRGYWDYPLANRGLLFAPVAFRRPLWQTPGWAYRPAYVVGYRPLVDSLFVRPGWRHYYFGDYYGPAYAKLGFSPWHTYGPRYHDPLFTYARWANRANPGWAAGLQQTYANRVAGTAPLPPRTLVQQNTVVRNSVQVVTPLSQVAKTGVKVQTVAATQLVVQRNNAQQLRQVAVTRNRIETARTGATTAPARALKLPGPVVRAAPAPTVPRPAVTNPTAAARPLPAVAPPKVPVVQPKAPTTAPRVTAAPARTAAAQPTITKPAPTVRSAPAVAPARPSVVQPRTQAPAPKPAAVSPRAVAAPVTQPKAAVVNRPAPAAQPRPAASPARHTAAPRPVAQVARSSPVSTTRAPAAPARSRPASSPSHKH